jgi:hypothetical protein
MLHKPNQRKLVGTATELQQISTWAMLIMLIYWGKGQIPNTEACMDVSIELI